MDWNDYLFIKNPVYQALLFLVLTPILIFVNQPKHADMAWVIAAYTFIFFLVLNATLLWFDESPWRYFFYSIGFAVGYLAIVAMMIPGIFLVLKLDGSGESARLFW